MSEQSWPFNMGYTEEELEKIRQELEDEANTIPEEEEDRVVEIELYDPELPFSENFESETSVKYILYRVNKYGFLPVLPNLTQPGVKVLTNFEKMHKFDMYWETIIVDYETMFGTRLLTFQQYSNFFVCDERVFFESVIIKFRSFGFVPFFWSYVTIYKEVGIKKDRAISIIKRFTELGILQAEIRTSVIDGRPSQVTYFTVFAEKIIELLPKIYLDFESREIDKDIASYLEAAIEKK